MRLGTGSRVGVGLTQPGSPTSPSGSVGLCWLPHWRRRRGSLTPGGHGALGGRGRAHRSPCAWLQDIPTGADSCVTSLSCDSHRSLIVAGLGDGSIRVYDRRMALSEW